MSERGFTFIEVIISLMLLAAAASILIGMEGAAVQRTVRDRNVQQAMLAARRILAAIETLPSTSSIPQRQGVSVNELLRELDVPETTDERERRILDQLQASLTVQDWQVPLPKIEENPMQRLDLVVAWGPEPEDAFAITYYVPASQEDEEEG